MGVGVSVGATVGVTVGVGVSVGATVEVGVAVGISVGVSVAVGSPVAVVGIVCSVDAGTIYESALYALAIPSDTFPVSAVEITAVFLILAAISSAIRYGSDDLISDAIPVINGAAIDVPLL